MRQVLLGRRGLSLRVLLVTLAALALACLPAGVTPLLSPPAVAAGDVTGVSIDYEPGYAWQTDGSTSVIMESQADLVTSDVFWEGTIRVYFAAHDAGLGYWDIRLAAPRGAMLTVGTYEGAVPVSLRAGDEPGMEVSGNATGCQWLDGSFTVHEIEMTDVQLLSLSASFEQRCLAPDPSFGSEVRLYGEVRFHATSGFKAAAALPASLDFGAQDTGVEAGTRQVTVSSIGTQPVLLGAATIAGEDASSFAVESNGCTGETLQPGESCHLTVSARPRTNRVLRARLHVADDTPHGRRDVPLRVQGLGEVDGTMKVAPDKFYPIQDGYKDTLVVEGTRGTGVSVNVEIRAEGSGALVWTGSLPPTAGDYHWTWDGLIEGATLAPAGKYKISVTLTDSVPNTKSSTTRVLILHDWVTWAKKSTTLNGRGFSLYGQSRGGVVSTALSAYAGGVRIASNRGFAAVLYTFPVPRSNIYGPLTFAVRGRSTNGHKALTAIWNPELGDSLDLIHYDAARKIGPGYRSWSTRIAGSGRVKRGAARAAVMSWKGLGGSGGSTFDIASVRLSIAVGTLHQAAAEALPEGQDAAWIPSRAWKPALSVEDATGGIRLPTVHGAVDPRPGDEVPAATPAPDIEPAPSLEPAPGDEVEAPESPPANDGDVATPSPGATPPADGTRPDEAPPSAQPSPEAMP